MVDDAVTLEREPDNPHDDNAILIVGDDDCELGYVPREEARKIAPLLDAGAEADAKIRRLWEPPDSDKVVPIVLVKVRLGDADPSAVTVGAQQPTVSASRGCGCFGLAVALFLLILVLILARMIRNV